MGETRYDAIVIGSGAGGCSAAWRLVRAGKRVLLVEKGQALPRDGSTLDVARVIHEGVFKSRETWRRGDGTDVVPEEYFNLGGKTKWYGAALLRFGEHEFGPDAAHGCAGWPIAYGRMAPYYEEVEQLLGVRRFECEPDLTRILEGLARVDSCWERTPLPMALAPDIAAHVAEASHFDGFASQHGLKGDAEQGFLSHLAGAANLRIITGDPVTTLLGASDTPLRIDGVELRSGQRYSARMVVLAAGALHSPRILQRYLDRAGVRGALAGGDLVGRNLKLHLLTAMLAVSASRKTDLIRKTTLLTNTGLPHSSVQPLGFDGELISTLVPRIVPRGIARRVGVRTYGFFLQTEDGSHRDNRVVDGEDGIRAAGAPPTIDYDAGRVQPALSEHERLVRRLSLSLLRAGYLPLSRRIGIQGTAHACGTLVTGDDPAQSVVDRNGRVHGLRGLYVADGSILPRSSRVNPSLTIYAWGLRVADRMLASNELSVAA